MSELERLFFDLSLPSEGIYQFSAKKIPGFHLHRIAKDQKGNPCLLLFTVGPPSEKVLSSSVLYNLTITYRVSCRIREEDKISEFPVTVFKLEHSEPGLQMYFLKVCSLILEDLGLYPNQLKIHNVLSRFVELFRKVQAPSNSIIQGLWAELLVILQSKNKARMVSQWHLKNEEKYDFYFGDIRVEVKSSSSQKREHYFSFRQLSPPNGARVFIVSILVEQVTGGSSIFELLSQISAELKGHSKLVEKLKLITLKTLGTSSEALYEKLFDFRLAEDSIRVFETSGIPKISSVPTGVSEVKFKSSLESVESMGNGVNEILALESFMER